MDDLPDFDSEEMRSIERSAIHRVMADLAELGGLPDLDKWIQTKLNEHGDAIVTIRMSGAFSRAAVRSLEHVTTTGCEVCLVDNWLYFLAYLGSSMKEALGQEMK